MPQQGEGLAADLRVVFAAEAASVQRYTYFAQVAEIEGHDEVAQAFRDLAESTTCVAHGHIDVMQDVDDAHTRQTVGDTRINLASSIADALRQADEVYPRLASGAHDEGHADVASWLTTLRLLKRTHFARLEVLLADIDAPSAVPSAPTALRRAEVERDD